MSPDRPWRFRIQHVLEAMEKIRRYTNGMTFEQFAADERTIDAVIRNFLIIGEAARHVPAAVRQATAHIPWKLMEGMRHVLVHDYDSVRLDTIWQTVHTDLPPLIPQLRNLVESE